MTKNGMKVLDSDMHLMEPVDLWQRYIDAKYKTDAPRGVTSENVRDLRMVHPDGGLWGLPPRHSERTVINPGHNFQKNQGTYRGHSERGWTAEVQLEAMDIEGIDVAVLYPTRGLNVLSEPHMEPNFAAALARAYNNWLYDFCEKDPNRLLGAGMLSTFDIDDAVKEARRCVRELGFRAVFLRSNIMNDRNWYDAYYEPLWSALEELAAPVGFHESSSSAARQTGDWFEPNFMLPGRSPSRWNRCSDWSRFAPAVCSPAIPSCAWLFSKPIAPGCLGFYGVWTKVGSAKAISGPRI
jgi:hypothetical protein